MPERHTRYARTWPRYVHSILEQIAVYCGAPAALDSFRSAELVLSEMAADTESTATS